MDHMALSGTHAGYVITDLIMGAKGISEDDIFRAVSLKHTTGEPVILNIPRME